jgi:thiamine pyrophosphate-dependent acetolactate synthase large subunit-like protein
MENNIEVYESGEVVKKNMNEGIAIRAGQTAVMFVGDAAPILNNMIQAAKENNAKKYEEETKRYIETLKAENERAALSIEQRNIQIQEREQQLKEIVTAMTQTKDTQLIYALTDSYKSISDSYQELLRSPINNSNQAISQSDELKDQKSRKFRIPLFHK